MAISTRIYRFALNHAGTGEPLPVLSSVVTPQITQIGEIEETLEREEGGFRLGNVSLTVRGLTADYFRDAARPDAPFVFEVADGNNAVWHGVVNAESVKYDQATTLTSFTVLSWEAMLALVRPVAARSVYDVDNVSVVPGDPGTPQMAVLFGDFFAGPSNVNVGDIFVVDGPRGEIRTPIRGTTSIQTDYGTYTAHLIDRPGYTYPLLNWNSDATTVERKGGSAVRIRVGTEEATRLAALFEPDGTRNNNRAWIASPGETAELLVYDTNGNPAPNAFGVRPIVAIEFQGSEGYLAAWIETADGGFNAEYWRDNVGVYSVRTHIPIKSGVSGKILGADVYGLLPGAGATGFKPSEVIDALFKVGRMNAPDENEGRPLGVLPSIVRSVVYDGGYETAVLPLGVELPDKALESLRMLQQTGEFFLRMVPTFRQVGSVRAPAVNVILTPRSAAVTGTPVAAPSDSVVTWTESAAEARPRSVTVKSNVKYEHKGSNADYIGVWFVDENNDNPVTVNITHPERLRYTSPPDGDDNIDIEVAIRPEYESNLIPYSGGKDTVFNDNRLRQWAQRFWSYYNGASRTFTATLAANRQTTNFVGKRVTFVQGDITYTTFVTKRSINIVDEKMTTSIEGIIEPTFTPAAPGEPVAIISGSLRVIDADGNYEATVNLDAARSYVPSGFEPIYDWERYDPTFKGGTWMFVGTGPYLNDTVSVVPGTEPSFRYRLTVSYQDGATLRSATDEETVAVLATVVPGSNSDPRAYTDQQLTIGNTGFIKIFLPRIDAVDTISFRSIVGAELPETIVWDTVRQGDDYDLSENGRYGWEYGVGLDTSHLSYIETRVDFLSSFNLEPLIVRWSFDADTRAGILDLRLEADAQGNVRLTVLGDDDTNRIRYKVGNGQNVFVPGKVISNLVVAATQQPGSVVNVEVAAQRADALTPGGFIDDDVRQRSVTVALTSTPTVTSGPFYTFGDFERSGLPNVLGTLGFDSDGDGTNAAGLQLRKSAGFFTVLDTENAAGVYARLGIAEAVTAQWSFNAGLRFPHANQTDAADGFIGSGQYGPGLNIVGTQTVAGQGRLITYWGNHNHQGGNFTNVGTIAAVALNASGAITAATLTTTGAITVGGTATIAAGTNTTHAVRGDRTITLTGANGVLISGGNSYVQNLASNAGFIIDTPQDIRTSATPQFARLGVGTLAPTAISGITMDVFGKLRVGTLETAGAGTQIGSNTFVGGFGGNGYHIIKTFVGLQARYEGELDSLTVRTTLNVYEILAREISSVNGNVMYSANAEVAAIADNQSGEIIIGGAESVQHTITTKGVPKLTVGSFVIGQMQAYGTVPAAFYLGKVISRSATGVVIERIQGAPVVGMTLARYDHDSDPDQRGYIYIATSDSGAPYTATRVGNGSGDWPPAAGTEVTRVGMLTGVSDFVNRTGAARSGLVAGSVGVGGWISVTGVDSADPDTGGLEMWQISERVMKVNYEGLHIGNGTSFLSFDANNQTFQVRVGGRDVITAITANGLTTLRLGGDGVSNIRLRADQIDLVGLLDITNSPLPNDVDLHTHVTFDGLGTATPVNTTVVMARGTNGTVQNSPLESVSVGVAGRAARFTGNSRLALGAPVTSPNYTISLWIKRDGNAAPQQFKSVVSSNVGSETHHILLQGWTVVTYNPYAGGGEYAAGPVIPDDGKFHHIVFSVQGGAGRFYMDGVFSNVGQVEAPNLNVTPITHIGGHATFNTYPSGLLDEVRLYTRALSATEARALFLSPSGGGRTQIDGATIRVGNNVLIDGNTGRIAASMIDANAILAQQITIAYGTTHEVRFNQDNWAQTAGAVGVAVNSRAFRLGYDGSLYATNFTGTGTFSSGNATANSGTGAYFSGSAFNIAAGNDYIRSNGSFISIVAANLALEAGGLGAADSMRLNNIRLAFGVATNAGFGGAGEGVWLGIDGGIAKMRLGQGLRYDPSAANPLVVGPMSVNADRMSLLVVDVELQFGRINPNSTTRNFINDGSAQSGIRFWNVGNGFESGYLFADNGNFGSLTLFSRAGLTGNYARFNANGITVRGKTTPNNEYFVDFDMQFDGGQPYFTVTRTILTGPSAGITTQFKFRAVAS